MKATLALENGLWYGWAAGAVETGGEVVFNTSLTSWEILTSPSWAIVTMTCPEISNTALRRRRSHERRR
jgi:carbamoylphosphate synthase small subunit